MSRGKTTISREEDLFLKEAESFFRRENISPPRFPSLHADSPFELGGRFKDLDTIEEASTPLSSKTNILFSTNGEARLQNPRDNPHETGPITQDLTTILSGDHRMPKSTSRPGFTLSTGANFSPQEIQTPQNYDTSRKDATPPPPEEDRGNSLGFTFSNKKLSQLKREIQAEEEEAEETKAQVLAALPPPEPSVPLVQIGNFDNLVALEQNMKESDIVEVLESRAKTGRYFTYAGPVLIAVNSGQGLDQTEFASPHRLLDYGYQSLKKGETALRPHLYSVTLSAYSAMIAEQRRQVVTLLGDKGTGKSQLMRHALQHLWRVKGAHLPKETVATKLQEMRAALDLLSIMTAHTSVEPKGLLTSDTAAFITKVYYEKSRDYQPVGCEISCKLLDCSLPKAKGARSFDAIHALFNGPSKKMLQNLGIGHLDASHLKLFFGSCSGAEERQITKAEDALRAHDSRSWKRLIECFDILEFSQDQIYQVLDMLAAVVLLAEQKCAVRSKAPQQQWKRVDAAVHKGAVFGKLLKLLGISETKFNEYFTQKNQKDLARQLRTLQRQIYSLLVEHLLLRINAKLQKGLEYTANLLDISLINFPGFTSGGNGIGSFVSNIGSEALNFFCAQQFMKMVEQLSQEGISMKCVRYPLCKRVIEFLLEPEKGLLFRLERMSKAALVAYLQKEEQKQARDEALASEDGSLREPRVFHLAPDCDTLMLRFTFGNACFSLSKLKNNISDYNRFAKSVCHALRYHSSHPLFKKMSKWLNMQLSHFANSERGLNESGVLASGPRFANMIAESMNPMLQGYFGSTPFIVYCLHSWRSLPSAGYSPFIATPSVQELFSTNGAGGAGGREGLPRASVARTLRNTLIHPILIWECFGFPDWIELAEFSQDFAGLLHLSARENGAPEFLFEGLSTRERAYAILICFAEALHFMVGTDHVLLKPGLLHHLQGLLRNSKKALAMRVQALPPAKQDYQMALRRMISNDYSRLFSPINCSWNPFEYDLDFAQEMPQDVTAAAAEVERVRKVSKRQFREAFDTASTRSVVHTSQIGLISPSGYSSLNYISGARTPTRSTKSAAKENARPGRRLGSPRKKGASPPSKKSTAQIVALSRGQAEEIQKMVRALVETPVFLKKYVDYSCKLTEIVRIQSWVRGFLVRKRKKWLAFAHYCAVTIQRHWKGFRQRKFFLFHQLRRYAAIAIQRRFRLHHYRRVRAARRIQRAFLRHLQGRLLPLETAHLDKEIARYEQMTKEVLGNVLSSERAKRSGLVGTLSPTKQARVAAKMAAHDLHGLDQEIAREVAEQKQEAKPAFTPTINEKSRRLVEQKRKQLERSGRKLERELFRSTQSGSLKSRQGGGRIQLIPTTMELSSSRAAPSAPPSQSTLLYTPPRELEAMGGTQQGTRERSVGDRLRERLQEKEEEAQMEKQAQKKKADFDSFIQRQELMEQKRKTRALQKREKEAREMEECSWSPHISKSAKKMNRSYLDLSRWNQRKQSALATKRDEKSKASSHERTDFKTSRNSERILRQAEKRLTSQILDTSCSEESSRLLWPVKEEHSTPLEERKLFTQQAQAQPTEGVANESHVTNESFLVMEMGQSEGTFRLSDLLK